MVPAVVESIAALRARLAAARAGGSRIGLVPTMGALHDGHARLIEEARRTCGTVVVTIFVNPLQFDRPDDLAGYPRALEADVAMCERLGADVVFAPSVAEMYPAEPRCTIEVTRIVDHMCGNRRPGHFSGVATVVMKLLQIAQPDAAYFGEKDAQQLAVIRRLVADFNVPVAIVEVPTVRESDGLAMSSRNRLLTSSERQIATALYLALMEADRLIAGGGRDAEAIRSAATATIPADPSLRLEYLDVVDPDDMQPVARIAGPVRVAGALWVGTTRLIDNVLCSSSPPSSWPPASPRQSGQRPPRSRAE